MLVGARAMLWRDLNGLPTTLEVKVWRPEDPEPDEWIGSVTDDTAALQRPGGVSLGTQLSTAATNAGAGGGATKPRHPRRSHA